MTPQERKVMELALEALEWFTSAEQGDEPPINKAITAITDALAQPKEPEPDYKVLWEQMCERCDELDKKLAHPEQRSVSEHLEPVAWMHVMDNTEGLKANGTGIVSITQKRKHPFGKAGVDFSKSYPVISTPFYTTPPQRKPMPLREVERVLYVNTKLNPNLRDDQELIGYIVNAVRAIEAAHKIIGEQK